jgi:predicted AAA+ superfamily ATPase
MATPTWHELCVLREDVRGHQLTLDEFAADLYDVRTRTARDIYRDPEMFFARTYPTYRMKELARNVIRRLDKRGGRPILRLQVAYGGGKTHTLITLLHLAEQGAALAGKQDTVTEFAKFADVPSLPIGRVALLPGDKHDVLEGIVVYDPRGQSRRVRTL